MKRIVVAGGSGFIGEPLVRRLLARGDDVAVLTRNSPNVRAGRAVVWNPLTQGSWSDEVANADVVINLAGENVGGGRWTEARKKRIMGSRVAATSALVEAMLHKPDHPRTFISASASGFYGDRGDEPLDENSIAGTGFLAEVTKKWEELARGAEPFARVVILRFGVVLAKDGGALAKLLLPFRLGAGGPMGSGQQWMPWIDRDDILRIIEWSIDRDATRGTYNATAPNPARNRDFARTLGRVLHRPAFVPTPAFALRLALGSEMANEMLLGGQRVLPKHAQNEGFEFAYPDLEPSLKHSVSG
ncbi:MAG: TIGR01777 family oxidoreductase [Acidobacteria bacterium]|nr:TIGR01777 family oxidoreductase [Acidobacteriota bacterium]MBV9068946.1 TIGR01777 family oxidoreductase [Acidobacteriota bacterium]MBV9185288.1 TIGR01777 family oxidoreductase [Acidobacteriota bacterium]